MAMRFVWGCLLLWLAGCSSTTAVSSIPGEPEQAVAVVFRGNRAISDRDLYRQIEDAMIAFAGDPSRVAAAFDAAQDLVDYYQTRGYPDIRVTHEIERTPKLRLLFTMQEGPAVLVTKLELSGNDAMSRDELMTMWTRTPSGVLGLGDPYFVEADLRVFAASVVAHYRSAGYLDAEVIGPDIKRDQAAAATVRLQVVEGALYRTRDVVIEAALQPPQAMDLSILLAKPYYQTALRALRIQLQRSLENQASRRLASAWRRTSIVTAIWSPCTSRVSAACASGLLA